MKLHHIGIACQDIEQSLEEFKKYHTIIECSDIVEDKLQSAKVCIIKTDLGLNFEFISGDQVSKMTKKGITYYHMCYEVKCLEATIDEFISKGAIIMSEPKPAILFNHKRVAFLYLSYGLIELLEE